MTAIQTGKQPELASPSTLIDMISILIHMILTGGYSLPEGIMLIRKRSWESGSKKHRSTGNVLAKGSSERLHE